MVKKASTTGSKSIGDGSRPHKEVRDCTKWCNKSNHNHTPIGNAHRSHGPNSFRTLHHNYYSKGKLKPAIRNRLKLYARKYRAAHKKGKKK